MGTIPGSDLYVHILLHSWLNIHISERVEKETKMIEPSIHMEYFPSRRKCSWLLILDEAELLFSIAFSQQDPFSLNYSPSKSEKVKCDHLSQDLHVISNKIKMGIKVNITLLAGKRCEGRLTILLGQDLYHNDCMSIPIVVQYKDCL